MAVSWITVLKSVPWSEVIRNAPRVADAAKKLWNTVGGKPVPAAPSVSATTTARTGAAQSIPELEARVAAAEATLAELQTQMLASSELIKTLAEQNTELVRRIELNRVRVLWLALAIALAGIVAVACLVALP